jgi:hypothetical protein
MTFFASLLAALKAIPALNSIFSKIIGLWNSWQSARKKAEQEKHEHEGRELAKRIEEAKTDEERARLIRELDRHSRSTPDP